MFKKLFNLIKLSSSMSASLQPKVKVIVKTTKMLKTTILVALIAFLTKLVFIINIPNQYLIYLVNTIIISLDYGCYSISF